MPYFNVDSARTYYEVTGTGHPILWLPPILRDHEFLRPFAQVLAEKYTTISIDLLGHGLSNKPKNAKLYSYENLAKYCHKLIQHLKIDKHDIIGMSWSGRIAITYTLVHRQKVRALILVASSGPKQQVAKPPENPELSAIETFILETVWQTPYDVLEDLKNIKVPTLILIGDKDPRLEAAHLFHENISNSTLSVIKGLGHELVEDRAICTKKILNWLDELQNNSNI